MRKPRERLKAGAREEAESKEHQAGQDAGKLTGQRGAPSDSRRGTHDSWERAEGLTLAALSLAASRHGEAKQRQSGERSRWRWELR